VGSSLASAPALVDHTLGCGCCRFGLVVGCPRPGALAGAGKAAAPSELNRVNWWPCKQHSIDRFRFSRVNGATGPPQDQLLFAVAMFPRWPTVLTFAKLSLSCFPSTFQPVLEFMTMSYEPVQRVPVLIRQQGPDRKRCWPISRRLERTPTTFSPAVAAVTTRLEGCTTSGAPSFL